MRNAYFSPLKPAAVLGGFLLLMPVAAVAGGDEPRLSISGYDPVAYFTDGKPVQGKSEIEYLWHKLRWRFANGEHRDLFAKNPDGYTPQYDGYCALGVSAGGEGHKDTVDPEAWAIVDGKLYLTHMSQGMDTWRWSSDHLAPHPRPRRSSRCATAGTGSSSAPRPRTTRAAGLSARATWGRSWSRWARKSRPA